MSGINLISNAALAEICPQLKQLRQERGLSLEELQAQVHIETKLLKRMEAGRYLPYSFLKRLLAFYGKSIRIVIE